MQIWFEERNQAVFSLFFSDTDHVWPLAEDNVA